MFKRALIPGVSATDYRWVKFLYPNYITVLRNVLTGHDDPCEFRSHDLLDAQPTDFVQEICELIEAVSIATLKPFFLHA
jgi:hypothetical protein